jgi:hypothetical protein
MNRFLVSDLPARLLRRDAPPGVAGQLFDAGALERAILARRLNLCEEIERFERRALSIALERSGWNAARTAELLGEVGRGASRDPGGTVRAMMRRLGLRRGMM